MRRLTEEEMLSEFPKALKEGQLCAYYQPKFNHSTGRLVGAEALMRWKHPEHGLQSPMDFIPVLEEHGLIHDADLYLFGQVCRFLKYCPVHLRLPISFNVSRHDLFQHDYVSELEEIRREYDISVGYLRAEITESSAIGGIDLVLSAINGFHKAGYLVAMDDFGSGYSSLNILKDLPVDILKLDLRFLTNDSFNNRSGIILNSAVQMAKWLETQVIAEGVETVEQADFLKSLGCVYVQGYLYSKPLPENEMLELLERKSAETPKAMTTFIKGMNVRRFWDPSSLETVIFNSFVGAAAIFAYHEGHVHVLRVNDKYVREFGMGLTEKDIFSKNLFEELDFDNRVIYVKTIERAIETGDEESCETWRTISSGCCGVERICIRSDIRVIGRDNSDIIIYAIIRNVTCEKKRYEELVNSDRIFRSAIEQANMYAWEYVVDTKEMHPCFRCMRDLGLPPVVRNYPEPAIEAGIIPPDYADMYRDWHRQIANGVKHLDAVIPLTVGRVPFHVRYTTEFDENGRPLKAYGSATLVVDGEKG